MLIFINLTPTFVINRNNMTPNKKGLIVKFHTPYEDEDPNLIYVILEYIEDGIKSRARISALNTNLSLPPINLVYTKDLIVAIEETKKLKNYLKFRSHSLKYFF